MKRVFISKRKRQFLCFLFLFFSSTLFLFQNCAEYQSTLNKSSSSQRNFNCKVQPRIPSPFENNKIQIDSDDEVQTQSASLFNGEDSSETQQRRLALLVDTLCIKQAEEPVQILERVVEVPPELEFLQRAAISFIFNGEIDMDQLTQDMENPCLVGITEDEIIRIEPIQTPPVDESNPDSASAASTHFNDPHSVNQAHLEFVNHSKSLGLQKRTTTSVVVAVIDSGIDDDHPDLTDQLWDDGRGNHGRNFAPDVWDLNNDNRLSQNEINQNINPNDVDDGSGHGTHVAGIIGAIQNNNKGTVGLAGSFVRLMAIRVLDNNGEGLVTDVYNGVNYAIGQGAKVINMSIGVKFNGDPPATVAKNATYEQAVADAVNAGVVLSLSGGNNRREITNSFCPSVGCFGQFTEGALTVASVDTASRNLSSFSNYGGLDIAAPGSENSPAGKGILSTVHNNNYGRKGGTSMAAPVVAAAAAFLIGYYKTKNQSYTPASIEAFLKEKGSREKSSLRPFVPEGRIIDFGLISEELGRTLGISCESGYRPNSQRIDCIPSSISCPEGQEPNNEGTVCVPVTPLPDPNNGCP